MGTVRITFTLDSELAEQARRLDVDVSAAAREGLVASVGRALAESDKQAYMRFPEQPDDFWEQAQAWSDA